jgi:hypothetical protein
MTNKNSTQLIGVISIVLLILVYFYTIYSFKPTEAEITATTVPVRQINVSAISNLTTQLNTRKVNGILPINVTDQTPRDNPFQ